ncbi:hypothetical protein ABIE12_002762 [Serratia sp. 509]
MKALMSLIFWLCLTGTAAATLHPVLDNPRISSCNHASPWGRCSVSVFYSADSTSLRDIPEVAPPLPGYSTKLTAIGLHCDFGSNLTGKPITNCTFVRNDAHSPVVENCNLRSQSSWELTPESTCNLKTPLWGAHSGAGPGGECVLFVQDGSWSVSSANTIHGVLTPSQVAQSGNAFCQKPLAPDAKCDLLLPSSIDHGVIKPNAHSVVQGDGTVDCGYQPVLTILGGSTIQLDRGVTTVLTTELLGRDRVRLTSTLDAINAEPGDHRASVVVIASPY